MAEAECVNCGKGSKEGKIVRACSKCKLLFCSECGSEGDRCPVCGQGFLHRG